MWTRVEIVIISNNIIKVTLLMLTPQTRVRIPMANQCSRFKENTCSELIIMIKTPKVIIQHKVINTETKYLNPNSEINLDPPSIVQHKKLKKGIHKIGPK